MPGEVDRFRFAGRKGQRLVVAAAARRLIPYLPDAVPGWFQAALTLYDARGNEVAYADHFRFDPDPVLYCEIPADGQYVIEIRDSIYRGREDFVYRITVGELPLVTSIFPLGGRAGEQTTVELSGWNLPAEQAGRRRQGQDAGRAAAFGPQAGTTSPTPSRSRWTALPECLEREPNDQPSTAQPVTLPIIVNGRIDRPGDCDVFRFDGPGGRARSSPRSIARRLGSPLDSFLKLTDAAGKLVAANDDYEDKARGPEHASRRLVPPRDAARPTASTTST